jgi:hypothetical protein
MARSVSQAEIKKSRHRHIQTKLFLATAARTAAQRSHHAALQFGRAPAFPKGFVVRINAWKGS